MTTVIVNGQTVDFDGAVQLMDDGIREDIHTIFALRGGGSDQDFVDMYAGAHEAQFGEVFAVN